MARPLWRLCSLLCLTALALTAGVQAQPALGKKYALVVGVRDYESGKFEPLRFTENDAEELAAVLRDQGGFAVRVLTSARGKKRRADAPILENLRAAIKGMLARKKREDTVLVALSGHGIQARVKGRDESFFCPSDAQLNDPSTLLGLGQLFKDLDACGAGVKLLLVDACRNDPTAGRNVDVDTLPRLPRGTAALFSCKSGERAFESAKRGTGHGVFFYHVIEGLKGKARNSKRDVTWGGLVEYVTEAVSEDVPKLIGGGAQQTPELKVNLTGRSPVLVRLGLAKQPARKRGYQSPQAVFAAASAASAKSDYKAFLACLTSDSEKRMAGIFVCLGMMFRKVPGTAKDDGGKAIGEVFARHGLTEEKLKPYDPFKNGKDIKEVFSKSSRALGELVKDRPAFVQDFMAALKKTNAKQGAMPLMDGELTGVTIDGGRAKGTLVTRQAGTEKKVPIEFARVGGGWKIVMPDLPH
jgi:hypothetical protein